MDMETRRVTVTGLRGADVATLRVLTQDLLTLPLNQIEASTLCDLFAISEVGEGMPAELVSDLEAFRASRIRELRDILDGEPLNEFVQSLSALNADQVPSTLRAAVTGLSVDRPESGDAMGAFAEHIGSTDPAAVIVRAPVAEAPSQAEEAATKRKPAKKAPKKKKASTAKDPARAEWIEEYTVSRIRNYETGLKEAILVGGTRHKAPWSDVTDREVRSVLRRLAREGKLRFSAGRWLMER
jgi:hypothetical protein